LIELARDVDTIELADQLLEQHISIAPCPIFSASQKYRNLMRLSCACEWSNRVERALAPIAGMIRSANRDARFAG